MVFDKKEVLILSFQSKEDHICLEENYAKCASEVVSSEELADNVERKMQQNPQLKYILTVSSSDNIAKSFDILNKFLKRNQSDQLVVLPNGMFFKIDKNSKAIVDYLISTQNPILPSELILVNNTRINSGDSYCNSTRYDLKIAYKISKDRYKDLYLRIAKNALSKTPGILHLKSSRIGYSDLKVDEFRYHEKDLCAALEIFIDQFLLMADDTYLYPHSKKFLITEDLEILTDFLHFTLENINTKTLLNCLTKINKYTALDYRHKPKSIYVAENLNLLEPFDRENFICACLLYFGKTEETDSTILKWHIKTPEEIKEVAIAVFDNLPKLSQDTLVVEA